MEISELKRIRNIVFIVITIIYALTALGVVLESFGLFPNLSSDATGFSDVLNIFGTFLVIAIILIIGVVIIALYAIFTCLYFLIWFLILKHRSKETEELKVINEEGESSECIT